MKFFGFIFRNVWRNPVRSLLTVGSLATSLFLAMFLTSYLAINDDVINSVRVHNRLVTMSAGGFSGRIPIARLPEIAGLDGITATTPFLWFGGKYQGRAGAFAQYAVDPNVAFAIFDELTIDPGHLRAFQDDRTGCIIGRQLADDLGLRIGDLLPLQGDAYPVNLGLTVRGFYDGPQNRNRRMCVFRWDYLDQALALKFPARAGNAGALISKCNRPDDLARLAIAIDGRYANSEAPVQTQSEEEFGRTFTEAIGDVRGMIRNVALAVLASLICVAGNSMAMCVRERVGEIAVLKAIGFGRALIVWLVVGEATFVASLGGLIGTLGCKALCAWVDIARLSGGAVPFFYVGWATVAIGLAVAILVGFCSGLLPAIQAARLSVVDGLRKVD